MDTVRAGVHVTHCCYQHGCKYGTSECPVKLGKLKQAHACEYCEMAWEENGSPNCGAAGCKRAGYWKWEGVASGCNLAQVVVEVFFFLCSGHDEWHRQTLPQFKARPEQKRIV